MRALLLPLIIVAVAWPAGPAAAAPPRGFIKGIALGMYADIKPRAMDAKLDEVKALGVDHVSIVVSWSSRDVRSSTIAPRKDYTTDDKVLARMIKQAHDKGLKVFLFPILDIRRRKPLEWRGTLKPGNWNTWWADYRRFIVHYGRLAAATRTELFCVGSELVTTEKMRGRWKALIGAVRRVYRGKLVYSANWDHYRPPVFWDLVDVVGLTGYYKLATTNDAGVAEMRASWRKVRARLEAWSRAIGRRFIFTELGYPSMDGTAVNPWDYTLTQRPDMQEQRRAYRAFIDAWRGSKRLAGVFFWDWYGEGGPRDKRYTTRGKPASGEIKRWYCGSPP